MGIGVIGTVLTLTVAVALPLRRSTRADVALELVSSSSRNTPSSLSLRRVTLAVHAAATVAVLVGAGLFVRTVQTALQGGAGFTLDRTLFLTAQIGSNTMSFDADRNAIWGARAARAQDLIDAIAGLPGVRVATTGRSPIGLDQAALAIRSVTLESEGKPQVARLWAAGAGPDYLEALQIPILAGRQLSSSDVVPIEDKARPRPVIVTAALARILWPGESPVGRRFTREQWPAEVVGVAADFAQGSLRLNQQAGMVFAESVAMATRPFTLHLTIGTTVDATTLVQPVRQALADVFPNAVGVDLATGRDVVTRDLGRERVGASFFSGFGLLALCLGLAGIFGLVAYHAESRRRDLGVRLALGATPRGLMAEIVMMGTTPVLAGTGVGLVIAAIAARTVGAAFFGVSAVDLLTYALVGAALIGGAFVAAITAARRVTRISPMDALRAL
jgi:hypothetical protein